MVNIKKIIMAEIENKNPKRTGRSERKSTKVDMTPLVDLAFLLITFFMLATTLAKPKVMEVNMPAGNIKSPVKHAITLLLTGDNKIYYYYGLETDKVKVSDFEKIRKTLLSFNRTYPNLTVVIKMDDSSKFGNLVDVLDEMVITNSKRYSISEISDTDKETIKLAKSSVKNF